MTEARRPARRDGAGERIARQPLRVVMLAFDGVNLLDIAGPMQAFEASEARRDQRHRYDGIVASVAGGQVMTTAGIPIVTERLSDIDASTIDTVMVGGGSAAGHPLCPPALIAWIAANAGKVRRLCSICAGAFVLAEAGLLDGRRATTHWHWAGLLQKEHPAARIEPDAIFVQDGKIWTSAGVTAGIDLTLALIEQDHGYRVAIETARRLVVFMKRPGGQSQFSVPLLTQSRADGSFADLHAWMRQNLDADLGVERLAAQASMSPRSFSRAYAARMGETPARTVEAMRAEAACGLLASTHLPLKQIAAQAGFGTEQNLRRTFLRRFGVNPGEYRQRFGAWSTSPAEDGRI